MNAHPTPSISSAFPFHLRWSSQQLADAVPLRLFELADFAATDTAAANARTRSRRDARSYLPLAGLAARFAVRG